MESFVNGVLGSAAKVIIDKPTAAYMPGMAMEELYGGQYRFNERAYNNYVNLTETLIEALSKDATNKTAYYAGRCTGDVVITAVGGVEFVYGLITTISGGSGSAAALATGIGIAAEPVTIAVTAEGVVTVVDGVNTIHYGITAFKKDADKGKEAKEADSKAAESGSNPKNVFPENPDDLLPEIPRNKATKANGTTSQTIQTSDNIRIRAEQHPLLPGETYNPRHHGVHYHVEYKVDPTKSWNNKNNVKKWYPEGYTPGAGSGFIPGEPFPE